MIQFLACGQAPGYDASHLREDPSMAMSESRPRRLSASLYDDHEPAPSTEPAEPVGARRNRSDESGWDAYRKWLSTVSGHERPTRTPVDRSVYSWKGYHSWADRVKQEWQADEG